MSLTNSSLVIRNIQSSKQEWFIIPKRREREILTYLQKMEHTFIVGTLYDLCSPHPPNVFYQAGFDRNVFIRVNSSEDQSPYKQSSRLPAGVTFTVLADFKPQDFADLNRCLDKRKLNEKKANEIRLEQEALNREMMTIFLKNQM